MSDEEKKLIRLRSKFIRFYRAKNKCECCGIPNYKVVLRGWFNGVEAYQDIDGAIFRSDNSEYLTNWYIGEVDKTGKKKFIKVVLTVAHLDHNIDNNSFLNLKAMCQKCHNNYDKNYRKSNRINNKNRDQMSLF